MAKIYFSYEPRKHIGGAGSLDIDGGELSPVAKNLLAGTERHQGALFGAAWSFFELIPGDFDSLDTLNETTAARLDEGQAVRSCDTGAESVRQLLLDFLALSMFWEKLALDALCDELYSNFVSRHSLSVDLLARFETSLNFVFSQSDEVESPALLLTTHLKACSEQAAQASREIKQRALDMYRAGSFRSKNQAAESIAPKIHRTVAVVRGWLRGI